MKREKCPCCKYPTLNTRGNYEICLLCDWEDDNQDDPQAAEVWGGPNGDYSLEEARQNLKAHLTMYRKKPKNMNSAVVEKKRMLMVAYESLNENNEETETAKWDKVVKLEQSLNLQGWD